MNQEPIHFEEESRQAQESTRRLKKRIVVVLICLLAFCVIAIPLIKLLDNALTDTEPEVTKAPPSSVNFAEPDYDFNIMKDPSYLNLNRTIYYTDERSGTMVALDKKNTNSYGAATVVLCDMIQAIIMGNADAYNALFSENYYAKYEPEPEFTMQRLYDIQITKVKEATVTPEDGGASYTQYEYEVSYKIQMNNGTFRTDIGHDESKKQYFVLSNSTGDRVLIDRILNFNHQS